MTHKTVIFCDFDGTITAVETFAQMLQEFAPQLTSQLLPLIYARKLTLKAGVRQILESIPVDLYEKIIKYTANQPIRSGLPELIALCRSHQVPFVVVSGGLKGMVNAVLQRPDNGKSLISQVTAIYAAEVNLEGQFLQVNSQFEGETELVAKVQVMAQYPAAETIAIGDSVTDIKMALAADLVFARDRLVDYLVAENKPYLPWDDFHEIHNYLASRWS